MSKYDRISPFFVWTNRKPQIPFDELTPFQQNILVDIGNSIARDGYPPTRLQIAERLDVWSDRISRELYTLRSLGYVCFVKYTRVIQLVVTNRSEVQA